MMYVYFRRDLCAETLERDLEVKEGDNPWLRVARLVDMTRDPKTKGDDPNARMRSILIRLKNES